MGRRESACGSGVRVGRSDGAAAREISGGGGHSGEEKEVGGVVCGNGRARRAG